MKIYYENFIFDFSGKKVRCNGEVKDKFSVAYLIDMISNECATIYYDVFTYAEIRMRLFDKLISKGCKVVQ